MKNSVLIHLDGHCIETGAKREYKRLLDDYFCSRGDPADLESGINLVGEFIKKSDFRALRSSDRRLDGTESCTVLLERIENGGIVISFAPAEGKG